MGRSSNCPDYGEFRIAPDWCTPLSSVVTESTAGSGKRGTWKPRRHGSGGNRNALDRPWPPSHGGSVKPVTFESSRSVHRRTSPGYGDPPAECSGAHQQRTHTHLCAVGGTPMSCPDGDAFITHLQLGLPVAGYERSCRVLRATPQLPADHRLGLRGLPRSQRAHIDRPDLAGPRRWLPRSRAEKRTELRGSARRPASSWILSRP